MKLKTFFAILLALLNSDLFAQYSIRNPKGKCSNMIAINMDTYPHTIKPGTKEEDMRLEFWG